MSLILTEVGEVVCIYFSMKYVLIESLDWCKKHQK